MPYDFQDTVVVCTAEDLDVFGVRVLTGEACAYGQRLLCDVNEDGQQLLREFWGLPTLMLAPAMNERVGTKPAVGSVMLERRAVLGLARFAMFRSGALAFWEDRQACGGLVGLYNEQRVREYEAEGVALEYNPTHRTEQPHVGARNVHAMLG